MCLCDGVACVDERRGALFGHRTERSGDALGVIGGGRSRYAVSGKADHIDNTKRLKFILNECSVGVDYAGIVVLLKTLPGLADAAGAAIDAMKLPDMLGCISGNDAVAIVARGEQEAERLCYDLRQYCK